MTQMSKDQILNVLFKRKGDYISLDDIEIEIDISKTEISDEIQSLIEEGYPIDTLKSGYRLNKTNIVLPYEIRSNLQTNYMGKKIYFFKEVDSTNLVAKKLANEGAAEGTIVIAGKQRRGKGSRGKKWISPSGGVWMTIILRPDVEPNKAPQLTLVTGVAVAETLIQECNLDVEIKWPNDILIGNKKVSGILTEVKTKIIGVEYVLVGIGIDLNINIPPELSDTATSLQAELEQEIRGAELIQKFLKNFEDNYNEFKTGNFPFILNKWRNLSGTVGKYVELHRKGGVVRGEAVGISKNGRLVLEMDNGNLKKVISGECIHINRKEKK
jgi:BirA family biotin operon repressor/biotin-[acetyl-CoA-carboxylase] ligase